MKNPITETGYKRLKEQLHYLKTVERPMIIKAIAEAREHGDLSENAEYHAARERQALIEERIRDMEDKLHRAEVIDTSHLSGEVIQFGATVTLYDQENGIQIQYTLVGQDESDVKSGMLSITSPVARALLGKEAEEIVEVTTPRGKKIYEIVKVEYIY